MRLALFTLALSVFAAGCGRETVAHRQVEREANRVLVALRAAGVNAAKVRDPDAREPRFHVTVAPADGPRALEILEAANLPRAPLPSSRDMVEAAGMIPTEGEERLKHVVGVEGDIVNSLRAIPGVVEVRAAVSVPRADPLLEPDRRGRPKASVLVLHDAKAAPVVRARDVQRFVQAKLPELDAADVDVVLLPATPASPQSASPPAAGRGPASPACEPRRVWTVDVCARSADRLYAGAVASLLASSGLAALVSILLWRSARRTRGSRAAT